MGNEKGDSVATGTKMRQREEERRNNLEVKKSMTRKMKERHRIIKE